MDKKGTFHWKLEVPGSRRPGAGYTWKSRLSLSCIVSIKTIIQVRSLKWALEAQVQKRRKTKNSRTKLMNEKEKAVSGAWCQGWAFMSSQQFFVQEKELYLHTRCKQRTYQNAFLRVPTFRATFKVTQP